MFKSIAFSLCVASVPFSIVCADQATKTLAENPYQQTATFVCSEGLCIASFPTTTAATTQITSVNCAINSAASNPIVENARLTSSSNGLASYQVPPFTYPSAPSVATLIGINASVNLFIFQGDSAKFILAINDPYAGGNCVISGFHS
jgi:hypothetical protein